MSKYNAALLYFILSAGAMRCLAALPPDFTATHRIEYNGLRTGIAEVSWEIDRDGTYEYESSSWNTGLISLFRNKRRQESSLGSIGPDGIRPRVYRYQLTGGRQERHAELIFDWKNKLVENRVDGTRWEMQIPHGTVDKLSVQIAMMQELGEGKTDFRFPVADGGKLKTYRFKVIGRETIDGQAGRFDTIKVQRLREDNRADTILWCAPSLSYLPVRILRREEDEDEYRSDLESYSESLVVHGKTTRAWNEP